MPDPVYAPMAPPRELISDPEAEAHANAIRREGFAVLPGLLSPAQLAAMRAALAPHLQGQQMGRNLSIPAQNPWRPLRYSRFPISTPLCRRIA